MPPCPSTRWPSSWARVRSQAGEALLDQEHIAVCVLSPLSADARRQLGHVDLMVCRGPFRWIARPGGSMSSPRRGARSSTGAHSARHAFAGWTSVLFRLLAVCRSAQEPRRPGSSARNWLWPAGIRRALRLSGAMMPTTRGTATAAILRCPRYGDSRDIAHPVRVPESRRPGRLRANGLLMLPIVSLSVQ